MTETLRYESLSPEIGRLTLSRPERCNAFSNELLRGIIDRLRELHDTPSVRVLILAADGKHFCGGLDLAEAASSDESARRMPEMVTEIIVRLRSLPQIVIAAAHGSARAGGGSLILASDLVVAADDFNIGFPEVQRGLEPILLFPLLRRRLSGGMMREFLLTGLPIDARRAENWGIVRKVVSPGEEFSESIRLAENVCLGDAAAVRTAKELIMAHETTLFGPLDEEFRQTLEAHVRSWHSAAAQARVAAFFERRRKTE